MPPPMAPAIPALLPEQDHQNEEQGGNDLHNGENQFDNFHDNHYSLLHRPQGNGQIFK